MTACAARRTASGRGRACASWSSRYSSKLWTPPTNSSVLTSVSFGSRGTTGSDSSRSSYWSSHSSQAALLLGRGLGALLLATRLGVLLELLDLQRRVLEQLGLHHELQLGDGHREDAQPLVDLGRQRHLAAALPAADRAPSTPPLRAAPEEEAASKRTYHSLVPTFVRRL